MWGAFLSGCRLRLLLIVAKQTLAATHVNSTGSRMTSFGVRSANPSLKPCLLAIHSTSSLPSSIHLTPSFSDKF